MLAQIFAVEKAKLHNHKILQVQTPQLAEGEVLFKVDAFAFTANNITYAAFGDAMQYWQFYPLVAPGLAGWGCIPVWGFATVLQSRCEGVEQGERIYGYWPMASHAVLAPTRVTDTGFFDGAPHRAGLHAVYNQYTRCAKDPLYVPTQEAQQMLLRPLFITSFLIDDFLDDNAFFGARTVLLSSASSKTTYGTAFCLQQRKEIKTIGLTSKSNLAFVQALGCYSQVVAYEDVASLPVEPAVYVDLSGSGPLRKAVHTHFADALKYSCAVGASHICELENLGKSAEPLLGAKPTLFFAPAQIKKRNTEWGAAVLQQRIAQAWHAFMQPVTRAQSPWMRVVQGRGAAAVEAVYDNMLNGKTSPVEGHVVGF
jgi:Protein of unknown function (DUF2855)